MDICPTSFPKKNCHIPKVLLQYKHVTKERGNKCGKEGDHKCKKNVSMVGGTKGEVIGMGLRW